MQLKDLAENKQSIHLIYNANYNGWIVEGIDEKEGDELSGKLADISINWVDEDGEYEYGQKLLPEHNKTIKAAVFKKYPNANIIIEIDWFST